jgi:hypothetical protein
LKKHKEEHSIVTYEQVKKTRKCTKRYQLRNSARTKDQNKDTKNPAQRSKKKIDKPYTMDVLLEVVEVL